MNNDNIQCACQNPRNTRACTPVARIMQISASRRRIYLLVGIVTPQTQIEPHLTICASAFCVPNSNIRIYIFLALLYPQKISGSSSKLYETMWLGLPDVSADSV